jgi:hypothetical protein
MLGLSAVAPRASRDRSRSAPSSGSPGARLATRQGVLFAERVAGADPRQTRTPASSAQLELFDAGAALQPGLVAQHAWRRGVDWIPGHPNHRPVPRNFEHPLRRDSERLAASLERPPESSLRRGLRELYDSFNIVVMGISIGAFLLLSLGSSVWVIKNFMGIDVFPQAHTSELLLGIEHSVPTGGGSGGGSSGLGGTSSAFDGLMQARGGGGGGDYPLMGSLGLGDG